MLKIVFCNYTFSPSRFPSVQHYMPRKTCMKTAGSPLSQELETRESKLLTRIFFEKMGDGNVFLSRFLRMDVKWCFNTVPIRSSQVLSAYHKRA